MITVLIPTPWPNIDGLTGEIEWSTIGYNISPSNQHASIAQTQVTIHPATHGDCQEILDQISNYARILKQDCKDNELTGRHELAILYKTYIVAHYAQGLQPLYFEPPPEEDPPRGEEPME